jgi:hypothetical protein
MFEQFFANLGINLLQGKDPLTATKDAGISTATGNMFGKAFDSFKVGSEVANQGVQNAEFVSPLLTDSAGTATTAINPTGYMGNTSMMQSNLGRVGELTPPPINPDMTARSMYPFQQNPAYSQPQVDVADLGAYDISQINNTQFPDYTAQAGTSDLYTGGGVDQPPSLLSKVYDKGVDMVSNIDAGDVATGGLLYMNKLEKDQQYKDYMNAQRMGMMKGGISRNPDKPTPAQILKVKVT